MSTSALLLLLATWAACTGSNGSSDTTADTSTGDSGETTPVDADEDGYSVDDDCDDSDPAVNPGALEICDGIDNNCVAGIDEVGGATVDGVNHTSVQEALAANTSVTDLVVHLCPTKKRNNIDPVTVSSGEKLTIVGLGGPDYAILDPASAGDLFTVEGGGELRLEGVSLLQPSLHPIAVSGRGRVTVQSCVVQANSGGIVVANLVDEKPAEVFVADSVVRGTGNTTASAIRLDGLFNGSVVRTTITENIATNVDGSGIYARSTVSGASTLVLDSVDFESNEGDSGVGLFASGVVVTANDSTFSLNAATKFGGALVLERGATFDGSGSTEFVGNQASDGGAVYISDGSLSGVHLHSGNGADRGGAILVEGADAVTPLVLADVRIEGNEANEAGGGLHIGPSTEVVLEKSSTLHGNVARDGFGGGAYLAGLGSSLTIQGALLSDGTSVNEPNDISFAGGKSVRFGTATPSVSCTFADLACAPL